MSAQAFGKLQVLVTGLDAAIARDVAGLIRAQGGHVVAADPDAGKLAGLEADLGRCRLSIETACVNLGDHAKVWRLQSSLRARNRLPQLMICCCAAVGERRSRAGRYQSDVQPSDVALSQREGRSCPARHAARVLRPTLFLHAEPLRHAAFDRTLSVIRHPTLRGLLARTGADGAFNPVGLGAYVRTHSPACSTRRQHGDDTTRAGRLRLVPPSDRPQGRADAA